MGRWYYDLHLHSCLSPCGGEEVTPGDLAGMCAVAGLDIVALTDHNTCGNCHAFAQAAEAYGLLALWGMELTTAEEIHVICLFPDGERGSAFSRLVYDRLPPVENDPLIFGKQTLRDCEGRVSGEEKRLLMGASHIGVNEVCGLVEKLKGVCFPAHIDRPSFSLLSQLGVWDPDLPFPLAEVSPHCPPGFSQRRDLAGIPFITNSDTHRLADLPDARYAMELQEKSAAAVLAWLRRGGGVDA